MYAKIDNVIVQKPSNPLKFIIMSFLFYNCEYQYIQSTGKPPMVNNRCGNPSLMHIKNIFAKTHQ